MSKWPAAFREASISDQAETLTAPKDLTARGIDREKSPYKPPLKNTVYGAVRFSGADRSVDETPAAVPTANVVGSEWDAETAKLIDWFERTPPPSEPFELCRGVTVLRPETLWAYLRRDIAAGPGRGRAYYGAFQADLKRLFELFGHGQDEPASKGQP